MWDSHSLSAIWRYVAHLSFALPCLSALRLFHGACAERSLVCWALCVVCVLPSANVRRRRIDQVMSLPSVYVAAVRGARVHLRNASPVRHNTPRGQRAEQHESRCGHDACVGPLGAQLRRIVRRPRDQRSPAVRSHLEASDRALRESCAARCTVRRDGDGPARRVWLSHRRGASDRTGIPRQGRQRQGQG